MKTYLIRIGHRGAGSVDLTEDEIRSAIEFARAGLDNIISELNSLAAEIVAKNVSDHACLITIYTSRLKSGSHDRSSLYRYRPYSGWSSAWTEHHGMVQESLRKCGSISEKINKFERKLNKGTLQAGDWFPTTVWGGGPEHNEDYDIHNFTHFGVSDFVKCPVCEEILAQANLAAHQSKQKCIDHGKYLKIIRAGYVHISEGTIIANAAKRGELPSEIIPVMWNTYVPKWVVDAQEVFKKENGFAGMKLLDFLKKMAPKK